MGIELRVARRADSRDVSENERQARPLRRSALATLSDGSAMSRRRCASGRRRLHWRRIERASCVVATLALDDEHARRVRLLLLGKGAVLAHRFDLRLAAELDEREQPPQSRASRSSAAALATSGRLRARRTRARLRRAVARSARPVPASCIGTAWASRPQPRRIPTHASAFAIACGCPHKSATTAVCWRSVQRPGCHPRLVRRAAEGSPPRPASSLGISPTPSTYATAMPACSTHDRCRARTRPRRSTRTLPHLALATHPAARDARGSAPWRHSQRSAH
jgi:hypothetical protein